MARNYRFFLRDAKNNLNYHEPKLKFILNKDIEPELFFQLSRVLRAKVGDQIILLNRQFYQEDGHDENWGVNKTEIKEFVYEVENANKAEIILKFINIKKNINELSYGLELALCLPNKPAKLDFILEKSIELGVSSIKLLKSDFSYFNHKFKPERTEKLIIEASEQSERGILAHFKEVITLSQYITEIRKKQEEEFLFIAMERTESSEALADLINNLDRSLEKLTSILPASSTTSIKVLIGPEGGFSSEEKALFKKSKSQKFSLGQRILRMETAAILALGIFSLKLNWRNYDI